MASRQEDEVTQKLNVVFKTMGKRGKEGNFFKEYTEYCTGYLLQQVSEYLNRKFDNCMILRIYGSAVEDLKCLAPNDVGDLDIVICPKSDDLMIHDEMIEYSVNPMHVKIKGIEHPVLQHCLVQDSKYVASSALKNFHSAIYGRSAPHLVDLLTRMVDILHREGWVKVDSAEWNTNETSPAWTMDCSQSFGHISEEMERLKNPQTLTNIDVGEFEWIAHAFCKGAGKKYSREHADVLKEYIEFANEVQMSYFEKGLLCQPQTFSLVLQDLVFSDRAKNFRDRVLEIETRMLNERGKSRDCLSEEDEEEQKYQYDLSENCHEKESDTDEEENTQETCMSRAAPSITAQTADGSQRSAGEDLGTTLSHSKVNVSSGKVPCCSSAHLTEMDENGNEESDQSERDLKSDSERESEKDGRPPVDILPSKAVLPPNSKHEYVEVKALSRRNHLLFEHLFKKITEEAKAAPEEKRKSTDTSRNPILVGFDLVPAFRAPGWPKVALDWIKRERKWPSPDIVHTIVQEGFHLVVKPPKKGGNPECDFRISFSNAEYLLSQEMNDIQRDCYRCLKKYHRAYLKEPKGLVTFHLKNVLLKTIEETGSDMWTESNRSDCVMKLLGSLLEVLVTRDLRHFFVGSYNLFGIDYIENPEILDSLAEKTVEILENPVRFAKLIEDEEAAKQVQTEKLLSRSDPAENTAPGQRDGEADQTSASGNDEGKKLPEVQTVPTKVATTPHARGSSTGYRFHDLKDVYLATGQDLIDKAFKEDFFLNGSDSMERCLVEDLREMIAKHNLNAKDCLKVFECLWDVVYWKVWMNPEPNLRRRMLSAFQGVIASMKYLLRQDDLVMGNEEAAVARMLDPNAEDPLDLSNLYPAGIGTQVMNRFFSSLERGPDPPRQQSMDDIPLD